MKNRFFILWFAGILGTIAVLPYAFTLQHDVIAKAPAPIPIIALIAIVQTAVLLAITVFFGLKLSRVLHLPVLTLLDAHEPVKEKPMGVVLSAVLMGIATGTLIVFGDMLFGRYIPELMGTNAQVSIWKTLLASLYGGVVEEILMRLFLVSLFAWILGKIARSAEIVKNSAIMWTAIVAAAVLFGLGHLPITSALTQITPIVIARAIILNGIGGLVFGWLYWKKGLEYGMVAHFTADIVLLAVLPALLK